MTAMTATPSDPTCECCGRRKSEHSRWSSFTGYNRGDDACDRRDSVIDPAPRRFRRRVEDMPRLGTAPHETVPLGVYIHSKSGLRYEVVGGTFDASGEADVVLVLYRSIDHGYLAVRPVREFASRFRPIGEASS